MKRMVILLVLILGPASANVFAGTPGVPLGTFGPCPPGCAGENNVTSGSGTFASTNCGKLFTDQLVNCGTASGSSSND
jgi:hypothetical protein